MEHAQIDGNRDYLAATIMMGRCLRFMSNNYTMQAKIKCKQLLVINSRFIYSAYNTFHVELT